LSNAHDLASATGFAAARRRDGAARAFAAFDVFRDPRDAGDAWAEIYADGLATPYQSLDFVELWLRTIGRAQKLEPLIVVIRDERGRTTALLPLAVRSRPGLRIAEFVGGKHANFHMGVFRAGLAVDRAEVADLLRRVARAERLDAFFFTNQPQTWRGSANPFAALGGQPSPSFAHATQIRGDFADWFAAHYSKSAQKKLRKKIRRLETLGPVSSSVARDDAAAREALAAFFAQKEARAKAAGVANDFSDRAAVQFLETAAHDGLAAGRAMIELRVLRCGERIVAVFGGMAHARRYCGIVTSYDQDVEIARSSPGEWLILDIVRDLHDRGFQMFDLGVGEARYKDVCCEIREPLFDAALAFTAKGRLASIGFTLARRAKRWIKRRPWAWSLAQRLRKNIRLREAGRRNRA